MPLWLHFQTIESILKQYIKVLHYREVLDFQTIESILKLPSYPVDPGVCTLFPDY